jgi:hypothetical protein
MQALRDHFEKLVLAVVSLALIGSAYVIFQGSRAFDVTVPVAATRSKEVPPLDVAWIEAATARAGKPPTWGSHSASPFVSRKYIVKDGVLVNPLKEGGRLLHPPVPNLWIEGNGLDILNQSVLNEDPDGDGFSNLDEWIGDGTATAPKSTDPQKKESHPAYLTKLRLARVIIKPFRLVLRSWEGDPAKPETLLFQINTIDVRQPTQFVKIDEQIARTNFKPIRFEVKKEVDANAIEKDLSTLTLKNVETGLEVALVIDKVADSPDSFALFRNLWTGKDFAVRKDQEFFIEPEPAKKYKLIDIDGNRAVIAAPDAGGPIEIPLLEAKAP